MSGLEVQILYCVTGADGPQYIMDTQYWAARFVLSPFHWAYRYCCRTQWSVPSVRSQDCFYEDFVCYSYQWRDVPAADSLVRMMSWARVVVWSLSAAEPVCHPCTSRLGNCAATKPFLTMDISLCVCSVGGSTDQLRRKEGGNQAELSLLRFDLRLHWVWSQCWGLPGSCPSTSKELWCHQLSHIWPWAKQLGLMTEWNHMPTISNT